jgi:hypothetical protein
MTIPDDELEAVMRRALRDCLRVDGYIDLLASDADDELAAKEVDAVADALARALLRVVTR